MLSELGGEGRDLITAWQRCTGPGSLNCNFKTIAKYLTSSGAFKSWNARWTWASLKK